MIPILEKYGIQGKYAIMSYIAEQRPLPQYVCAKFESALSELKQINPESFSTY